jgi:hypothetical protein
MNACPKIDDCTKVTMVLDKDYSFDWQYASELHKVCHNCLAGVRPAAISATNQNGVTMPYLKTAPQYR